ncbi:hypothetical protein PC119_g23649 [Phytophthora cactorum]|nr:hypothetical protein PC119_g23649 [Phytophthora cactorum]
MLEYSSVVIRHGEVSGRVRLARTTTVNSQFVHFAGRNIRRAHSLLPTAAAMGALPVKKRKTDVGAESMHLHFANLVDTRVTDVFLAKKELALDNGEQWKPLCCFPGMEEDLLLYLEILGGTSYSGYYDLRVQNTHSTKIVFLDYMRGKVCPVDENSDTRSNNYKTFENMIAQALLESSVASELFDGYMKNMSSMTIPFLTPPNARWPQCIDLNTGFGCNFGHLVRARNNDRCDVYVKGEEKGTAFLLCECKYWSKTVDIRTMRGIITGLNESWEWTFVLVLCVASADFHAWEKTKTGCVKIDSQNGHVEWKSQSEEEDREKLVIIVETGVIRRPTA